MKKWGKKQNLIIRNVILFDAAIVKLVTLIWARPPADTIKYSMLPDEKVVESSECWLFKVSSRPHVIDANALMLETWLRTTHWSKKFDCESKFNEVIEDILKVVSSLPVRRISKCSPSSEIVLQTVSEFISLQWNPSWKKYSNRSFQYITINNLVTFQKSVMADELWTFSVFSVFGSPLNLESKQETS